MPVTVTFDKVMAIVQMEAGSKMTHPYFTEDEWVTIHEGKMLFEDGVKMGQIAFWADRSGPGWQKDWTYYKPN